MRLQNKRIILFEFSHEKIFMFNAFKYIFIFNSFR